MYNNKSNIIPSFTYIFCAIVTWHAYAWGIDQSSNFDHALLLVRFVCFLVSTKIISIIHKLTIRSEKKLRIEDKDDTLTLYYYNDKNNNDNLKVKN